MNLINDRVDEGFGGSHGARSEAACANQHFGQSAGRENDVISGRSRPLERSSGTSVMRVAWIQESEHHTRIDYY